MAQIVIRNLDETVKARLKRRAARHGHSLEQEIRDVLHRAVEGNESASDGLGTFIARQFAGKGLDFEIPEWHGEAARPAKFRT
jgi:plasmid stability protein